MSDELTVRLDLTQDEAVALVDLCRQVAGDPVRSRRQHTAAIMSTLIRDAGVAPTVGPLMSGSVWFHDYRKEGK